MKATQKKINPSSGEIGVKMRVFRFLIIFLSLGISACATLAPEISINKTPTEIINERIANARNSIEGNQTPMGKLKDGILSVRNLIEGISKESQSSVQSLAWAVPYREVEEFKPALYLPATNTSTTDKTLKIQWVTTDTTEELIKGCTAVGAKMGLLGCATWSRKACTIITPQNTTLAIIGHEFRHCFTGNFH